MSDTNKRVNTEEKKGLLRLMELMDKDGTKFLKAGALAVISMVPFLAAVVAAVASLSPVYLLVCIPFGMLAAPQICGVADTVMRSMRDEIGWWWWDTYKTAWKRNAKATLLPGAIFGLVAGLQIYSLYIIAMLPDPTKEFWMLAAAAWVEFGILSYYLPMLVCMELPMPSLLRNCFVLFFCHPIKSLLASLVQLIYYAVILIWFPLTSLLLMLGSVWMPMLPACTILYPVLDKHFHLKETCEELQRKQWEEE